MGGTDGTAAVGAYQPAERWQRVIQRPGWLGLLLLAGVLVVYTRTLAPGVLGGDPGELQFVPDILSMTHLADTPLYVLLGKLWSELPLGPSIAWRMNSLAAVSASLAVWVVYHTVYLLVERVVRALALAFGMTFWEQALMADEYAFNADGGAGPVPGAALGQYACACHTQPAGAGPWPEPGAPPDDGPLLVCQKQMACACAALT